MLPPCVALAPLLAPFSGATVCEQGRLRCFEFCLSPMTEKCAVAEAWSLRNRVRNARGFSPVVGLAVLPVSESPGTVLRRERNLGIWAKAWDWARTARRARTPQATSSTRGQHAASSAGHLGRYCLSRGQAAPRSSPGFSGFASSAMYIDVPQRHQQLTSSAMVPFFPTASLASVPRTMARRRVCLASVAVNRVSVSKATTATVRLGFSL